MCVHVRLEGEDWEGAATVWNQKYFYQEGKFRFIGTIEYTCVGITPHKPSQGFPHPAASSGNNSFQAPANSRRIPQNRNLRPRFE
jgi:hypothetical protein